MRLASFEIAPGGLRCSAQVVNLMTCIAADYISHSMKLPIIEASPPGYWMKGNGNDAVGLGFALVRYK